MIDIIKDFKNIDENEELRLLIDNQKRSISQLEQLNDQIKILQAVIDLIGKADLGSQLIEIREGSYDYISVDLNDFFDVMFMLDEILANDPDYKHGELKYRPCSVLEVGCGIGRNIFLLTATDRFQFSSVRGFDVIEEYIQIGQKCFGLDDELFVDNCMKVDYSEYDIVFFFRIFSDSKHEVEFEDYLVKSMKSGAYLVSFMSENLEESRLLTAKNKPKYNHTGKIWKRT